MAGLYAQALYRTSGRLHDCSFDGIKTGQHRLILCGEVFADSLAWIGGRAIEFCCERQKLSLECRETGIQVC